MRQLAESSTGVEMWPLTLTPCEAVALRSACCDCPLRFVDESSGDPSHVVSAAFAGLAEDLERMMTEDRDIVRGSLDTVSGWRLTRPADVPGQSSGQADYVLIAEILEVERFEQQASEHIQRLADDLAHLVSSRGMLVVRPVL